MQSLQLLVYCLENITFNRTSATSIVLVREVALTLLSALDHDDLAPSQVPRVSVVVRIALYSDNTRARMS